MTELAVSEPLASLQPVLISQQSGSSELDPETADDFDEKSTMANYAMGGTT